MKEKPAKTRTAEDEQIEREVRSSRKFSLAEAIGREGADLMKGASPITRKRQTEFEIDRYLQDHLEDGEGILRRVLVRRVSESDLLLDASYADSLAVLVRVTERVLSTETGLREFVRTVDFEWGRVYDERPVFEREGSAARPGDPYTVASVRAVLAELLNALQSKR